MITQGIGLMTSGALTSVLSAGAVSAVGLAVGGGIGFPWEMVTAILGAVTLLVTMLGWFVRSVINDRLSSFECKMEKRFVSQRESNVDHQGVEKALEMISTRLLSLERQYHTLNDYVHKAMPRQRWTE